MSITTVIRSHYLPWACSTTMRSHFRYAKLWRQNPVTSKPLPYEARGGTNLSFTYTGYPIGVIPCAGNALDGDVPNCLLQYMMQDGDSSLRRNLALERSYNRLRDLLIPNESQLGATIAEWRSTGRTLAQRGGQVKRPVSNLFNKTALGKAMGLWERTGGNILQRSTQLYQAYRDLKRGRFKNFTRKLQVKPKRRHAKTIWTRPKDASALWLEYWFGWAPLVGDIYDSIAVLETEIKPIKAFATATVPFVFHTDTTQWDRRRIWDAEGKLTVRQGAQCIVTNPNQALRQRMGLLNPASIVWELIPFSFVVDWFSNLGNTIGNLSAYAGCEINDAYTTTFIRGRSTFYHYNGSRTDWLRGSADTVENWSWNMKRELGLTKPVPQFIMPARISNTRAATAISLLVVLFTKG
jgi:hypothetical protein